LAIWCPDPLLKLAIGHGGWLFGVHSPYRSWLRARHEDSKVRAGTAPGEGFGGTVHQAVTWGHQIADGLRGPCHCPHCFDWHPMRAWGCAVERHSPAQRRVVRLFPSDAEELLRGKRSSSPLSIGEGERGVDSLSPLTTSQRHSTRSLTSQRH